MRVLKYLIKLHGELSIFIVATKFEYVQLSDSMRGVPMGERSKTPD